MPNKKLYPPEAVCTYCKKYAFDELTNKPCVLCKKGSYKGAVSPNSWKPCPNCLQAGSIDKTKCLDCQGYGWVFIGK